MYKYLLVLPLILFPFVAMASTHEHNDNDESSLYTLCHNTIDDDHDGFIDLLDSDCAQYRPVCLDGFHSNEVFECVPNIPEDPICTPPQLLVNHECVTPQPPECTPPQILSDVQTCIDPPPVVVTCESPQILVDNECVNPPVVEPTNPNGNDNGNGPQGGGGGGSGGGGGPISGPFSFGFVNGYVPPVTACTELISKYLRKGWSGNDEGQVVLLQNFLNNNLGLTLPLNGIFDEDTENAVRAFQLKFSDDVLKPWHLTTPTGITYITTRHQINKLWCASLNVPLPDLTPWHF